MAVQRRRMSMDLVKEQGKLVAQVMKERQSAMDWENNWGFLSNKNKFLEEEAIKMGWTKEEFWDAVHEVFSKKSHQTQVNPCDEFSFGHFEFPRTSNGMYGWRNGSILEVKYKPTIPPVKEPPQQNFIFLG